MSHPLQPRRTSLYLLLATVGWPLAVLANPQVDKVIDGSVAFSNSNGTFTATQTTDKALVNFKSFDIGGKEVTSINQPSINSLLVGRITQGGPSQIDGHLSATGNLILINPNGVVFGKGAVVDVNSLVATTSDISDANYMAGRLIFDQPGSNPNAKIINRGTITVGNTSTTAREAGLVGLVAPNVINSGTITANLGHVQLSSGDTFTLDLYGDGLFSVQASDALQHQLVRNTKTGIINANGGRIDITAAAARGQVDSLIDVGGELNANAVGSKNGHIYIFAEGVNATNNPVPTRSGASTVQVSGHLSATNSNGQGGRITVTADRVGITSTARIDASGTTAGGVIAIGGDLHGGAATNNPSAIEMGTLAAVAAELGPNPTPNALYTVVQSGAIIQANATDAGHGGLVSVWSDNRTEFAGTINANGGPNGGDGGLVETSGKAVLQVTGVVNALGGGSNDYEIDPTSGNLIQIRRKGQAGEWLLDPADITIDGSGSTSGDIVSSGSNPINYTANDNSNSSFIGASIISAQLQSGTNVVINTGNVAGGGNGDITVNAAIDGTGGTSGGGLTLSAYRNIIINANISLNNGALILQADNADATSGSGNGSGYINIGANISTNGGNITMGGGSGVISAGTGYATGNSGQGYGVQVQFHTTVRAGNGNIIMNGIGYNTTSDENFGVALTGLSTVTGNGNITIHGTGGAGSGNKNDGIDIETLAYNALLAENGTISLQGLGGALSGHGVQVSGAIVAVSGATGAINIDGTGTALGYGGDFIGAYSYLTIIEATSTGNITITGTGTNGGISMTTPGTNPILIAAAGGNITLTGVGLGANAGTGIITQGSTVSNTGSGNITINGTSGTGGTSYVIGMQIGNGTTISAVDGNITLNGITLANSTQSYASGLTLSGGLITTAGTGNIDIYGGGGNATGFFGNAVGLGSGTIAATGGGNITIAALQGTGFNAPGIEIDSTNVVVTSNTAGIAGNVSVYTDSIYLSQAGDIISGGTLTIAPFTAGNSFGVNAAGNFNFNRFGYVTGAAYVFGLGTATAIGSTGATAGATGEIHISGNDFGNANVTFVNGTPGTDITLDNAYTSTGTGSLTISSYRNIIINTAITLGTLSVTGGALLLDADNHNATTGNGSGSGYIGIGGNINTNGGNIIMGGGSGVITADTGYATGNSGQPDGIFVNSGLTINSGTGNIIMNGQGGALTGGGTGIGMNGNIITTGSGTISLNGTGGALDTAAGAFGVFVENGATVSAQNGNINLIGLGGGTGSNNYNFGVVVTGTVSTTGTGNIFVAGTGGNSSGGSNYGIAIAGTASGISTTGGGNIVLAGTSVSRDSGIYIVNANNVTTSGTAAGNITLLADAFFLNTAGNVVSGGTLTIAPHTHGNSFAVGPATGSTVNFSDAMLGDVTGSAYVFGLGTATVVGSTGATAGATGSMTINTTADFGAANVSFVSNSSISLTGNLTKLTGTGTANYTLNAAGAISNLSGDGISATSGAIDLVLNSNTSGGGGTITLTNAPLNVNGGTITLNSSGQAVTQSGTVGGNETINASGAAVSIGTLNGDAAGTRSLVVNAGTGTFTTTSTIGATHTLNNLTTTAGTITLNSGGMTALGTVSLTASGGITLPSITAGDILVVTTGVAADVTIASGSTLTASGTGNAITLAAKRNFINHAGAGALVLSGTGSPRWLIYSTNPSLSNTGSLANDFNRYNCSYSGGCAVSIPSTGDGFIYTYSPTLTITAGTQSIVYGNTATLTGYATTTTGYLSSDASADVISGSLGTASTNYTPGDDIGGYSLNATGSLTSALGYTIMYGTNANAITVGARTVTASLIGSVSKTYDGTTSATLTSGNYSLGNVYSGDSGNSSQLALNYATSGTYDTADVGTSKTVSVSGLALTGSKFAIGDYVLASTNINGAVGTIAAVVVTPPPPITPPPSVTPPPTVNTSVALPNTVEAMSQNSASFLVDEFAVVNNWMAFLDAGSTDGYPVYLASPMGDNVYIPIAGDAKTKGRHPLTFLPFIEISPSLQAQLQIKPRVGKT